MSSVIHTVLCRTNGEWDEREVHLLINKIGASVSQDQRYPEYLILFGSYPENKVSKVLRNSAFSINEVRDSSLLPFRPIFK